MTLRELSSRSDHFGLFPNAPPWSETLVAFGALVVAAVLVNFVLKYAIGRLIARLLPTALPAPGAIAARLANIPPALIISAGIVLVPNLPEWLIVVIHNVIGAFVILVAALAISSALNFANALYTLRPDAGSRPIKGYIQLCKIALFITASILIVAVLAEQSPLLLLSGLGAMAAVLMLVFKDTILSLVASVQLTSDDMLRVGDWIEMPQLNADGDVIDIALHTVKVQNWDKTITTIPTYMLISESFRNWRGMYEAGGRRIKRSLMIDQTSVRFLDAGELARLKRFSLISGYLDGKEAEIGEWNAAQPGRERDPVNARRITNLGTFRAYMTAYLKARGDLSSDLFLVVRQLAPSENGLPLEIYGFTSSTAWAAHENVQGDIFDHLIAIMPEFGLRVFQRPTGQDFSRFSGELEL